jgi:hypothetical protein
MDVRLKPNSKVMRSKDRFLYAADPLCLIAAGLYLINRFWAKQHLGVAHSFLRNHLDDCLFIPAALPLLLWLFRRLRLRVTGEPPALHEVIQWIVLWSVMFEWLFPRILHKGTADWYDVLCYAGGGVVALVFWHRNP